MAAAEEKPKMLEQELDETVKYVNEYVEARNAKPHAHEASWKKRRVFELEVEAIRDVDEELHQLRRKEPRH